MGISFTVETAKRAAADARAMLAATPRVEGESGPRLEDMIPEIPLDELNAYASAAEQFIADPIPATVSIAGDYLQKTVAEEVTSVVTQYVTQALTTAGGAIGTAIPVPVVGTLIGAAAGKVLGETIDHVTEILSTHVNVDPYVDVNGARIPEVETVLERWSGPGAPISRDVHDVANAAGKGLFCIWGGYRWNVPVRYYWGPFEWATPDQIAAMGGAGLWPAPTGSAALADRNFNARKAVAEKMRAALERELSVAMQTFATRRANESQAKAMTIHRMIYVAATGAAPRPRGITDLSVLTSRLGAPSATLADFVAYYLGGGTAGRVAAPRLDAGIGASYMVAEPVKAAPITTAAQLKSRLSGPIGAIRK